MIQKATKYTKQIQSKFREHASTAIIAALSFLIALSWKDLIIKLVQDNLSFALLDKYPYIPELLTAITITLIAILGIAIISLWLAPEKE